MKRTGSPIKIGTRGSPLALAQIEEIKTFLAKTGKDVDFEVSLFETAGDKDRKTSLTAVLPDDFFTDSLDWALLDKKIDVAIHSAKDLPQIMKEGLSILALTESIDDTDAFVGPIPFRKLKRGAKIGTSSPLRQKSIKELNPHVKPCDIRGNIETRLKQLDSGKYDGIIVATCALKRLGLMHRVRNIMPWEATPLQGQLAVVGRCDDDRMARLFDPLDARRHYGTVHLVGAGPGDAQLITLKGVNLLGKADVVFYDYLINKSLLRHAKKASKIYVGKRKGVHTLPQHELNKKIKEAALAGKMVVRLKGGDPLIFGRGADEIDYLLAYHIDVKVVPGVSSATGIPSGLGIPLTARGISDSVAFVSGHSEGESGGKNAGNGRDRSLRQIPDAGTLVFLMGLTKLKEIVTQLKKKGWRKDTPVIIISKGTCFDEEIISGDLNDIHKKALTEDLQPPALIIIGETVRFYKPKARTVLYTGTDPKEYKKIGKLIHLPMIEISPRPFSVQQRRRLIRKFSSNDLLLLTSRFGVKYFFDILKKEKVAQSMIKAKIFVAIGKATARALVAQGIKADLIADVESSEGLFKEMKDRYKLRGMKILFPRSELANPYLKMSLKAQGAKVTEVAVYQNRKPLKRDLPRCFVDEVIFTSPSTVKNFLKDYGTIPRSWKVRSRGELTRSMLKEAGFESEVL